MKLSKIAGILTLLALPFISYSQSPIHSWTAPAQGTGNDAATSVTYDLSGNVYETGYFSGTVDFDPGAGVTNLVSAGAYDIYLRKTSAAGNLVWAVRMGGAGNDVAWGIVLDLSGDILTTGYFTGVVDFDPGVANVPLTSTTGSSVFVSRLNNNGIYVWAKGILAGANAISEGRSIVITQMAQVVIGGILRSTVDADPNAGVVTIGPGTSANHAFVLALSDLGVYSWSTVLSGPGTSNCYSLDDSGPNGDIYYTGSFGGTIDADPSAATGNFSSAGGTDIFVSKLNAGGTYSWFAKAGASGLDVGWSVTVDAVGNTYATGSFSGTADFDPTPAVNLLTSAGAIDAYVWKLSAAGALVWAESIGGTNAEAGTTIARDPNQNIIVGGYFFTSTDLDPSAGVATFNSANTSDDGFVVKLNSSGNYIYGAAIGSTGTGEQINCVAGGVTSNVYIAGQFTGNIDSDPGAGTNNVTNLGMRDGFVTRWYECTAAPAMPSSISGNTSICPGTTNTYSITPVADVIYTWTLPAAWTGTSTTNSITATAGTGGGVIQVTATNSCGTSPPRNLSVSVIQIPTNLGPLTGASPICEGTTVYYAVNNYAGSTYTWTLPPTWTGSSTTNSITAIAGSGGGTITVVASNACGTGNPSSMPINVTNIPASPINIGGPDTVCANASATYACSNMPGATSYTWTLPAGWSGSATWSSINVVTGTTGGVIQVTADNACGSSSPSSFNVLVDTIPLAPASIIGTGVLCEFSPFACTCPAVGNATSYNWTYPSGWTASATTNSLSGTVDNTGGLISVTATNQCGTSNATTLSVTVNPMPVTTITTTSGYLESDQSGASYQWLDCGNSMNPIAFATSQQFTPLVNGSYAVVVDLSGCIDTSACDSFLSSAIADHTASLIQIYPNPSQDVLNISSSVPVESIVICDLTGRVVLATGRTTQIDISTLVPAVYIVNIQTSKGIISQRILKE